MSPVPRSIQSTGLLMLAVGVTLAPLAPTPSGAAPFAGAMVAKVQTTEEGQHVVFDGYSWKRRELAKRLPLDQPWPDKAAIDAMFARYGLDRTAPPDTIPVPTKLLTDVYLIGSKPNNSYLVDCGGAGLLVIDPGLSSNFQMLLDNIQRLGFSPKRVRWVINTHAHLDHSMADAQFRAMGAKILIGSEDADAVEKAALTTAKFLLPAAAEAAYPRTKVDWRLSDGEEVDLGDKSLIVIHTPGHTDGSDCFFLRIDGKNVLISGDTALFDYRLGLQTIYANNRQYVESLRKLDTYGLKLDSQVRWDALLPGHGTLVLDRAYMDIDKALEAAQADVVEGRAIDPLPFDTRNYRRLMYGRP